MLNVVTAGLSKVSIFFIYGVVIWVARGWEEKVEKVVDQNAIRSIGLREKA
jgi:hypothetical protein